MPATRHNFEMRESRVVCAWKVIPKWRLTPRFIRFCNFCLEMECHWALNKLKSGNGPRDVLVTTYFWDEKIALRLRRSTHSKMELENELVLIFASFLLRRIANGFSSNWETGNQSRDALITTQFWEWENCVSFANWDSFAIEENSHVFAFFFSWGSLWWIVEQKWEEEISLVMPWSRPNFEMREKSYFVCALISHSNMELKN